MGVLNLEIQYPSPYLRTHFVSIALVTERSRKGMIKSDDFLGLVSLSMYKRTPVRVSIIIHKHAEKVELNEMCQIARQR